MQVRAMLIAACLMAITDVGSAMASDSPAPSANSSVTRRRAVDPPRPPSHILVDVSADDDLRYTNHNLHPVAIKTCIERSNLCVSDTLPPGASITRAGLLRTFGRDRADLEIYAPGSVEIRGRFDALPLTLATSDRQFLPIMSTDQTLKIYALTPDTLDIHFLGSNGVRENTERVSVHRGVNIVTLPFPSTLGKQLDLNPTTPIIAVSNDGHRVKSLFEAIGVQYLVTGDNHTVIWVKNPDPTSILTLSSNYMPRNTDNAGAGNFQYAQALNFGITTLREMTGGKPAGAFSVEGVWANNRNTPFLSWAPGLQTDGASANNSFGPSGQKYDVSLNQVPAVVTLFNASSPEGVVNGTITGYDDTGAQTGTLTYELPTRGNRDLDVSALKAARITVSANDAAQSTIPNILIGAAINGVEKAGFRVEKPAPRVTGEQYVTKWLDRLQSQGFYLSRAEILDMINGTALTPSYIHDISRIIANGPPRVNPNQVEQSLKDWQNGDLSDGELTSHFDPLNTIMRNPQGLRWYFADGRVGDNHFAAADAFAWYELVRRYLAERVVRFPDLYGGSIRFGPDMDHDPTWSTQDIY